MRQQEESRMKRFLGLAIGLFLVIGFYLVGRGNDSN